MTKLSTIIFPLTSNFALGVNVPIPTLPLVGIVLVCAKDKDCKSLYQSSQKIYVIIFYKEYFEYLNNR